MDAKDIISRLISYLSAQNTIGFTYAEAMDDTSVAHLNVYMTMHGENTTPGTVPAKRIRAVDCTQEEGKLIQDLCTYLMQEETTGFDYEMHLPDSNLHIDLHVRLHQYSNPEP